MNHTVEILEHTNTWECQSQSGSYDAHRSTPLRQLLDSVVSAFRSSGQRLAIDVKTDYDASVDLSGEVPDQLKTAIGLLLCEALATTEPGDQIIVATRLTDNYVGIEVADTGRGIPEAVLLKITETTVTMPTSDLLVSQFAQARSHIEECGGYLEIDSLEGVGTRAALWLPTDCLSA